jgi:hypothetical protein
MTFLGFLGIFLTSEGFGKIKIATGRVGHDRKPKLQSALKPTYTPLRISSGARRCGPALRPHLLLI